MRTSKCVLLVMGVMMGSAVVPVAGAEEGPDKTYKITMNRPLKVGDKQKVRGTASSSEKIVVTAGHQPQAPKADAMTVDYSGEQEILAVGAGGEATKVAVTFDKCIVTTNGDRSDLVPKDGVVVMEQKDGVATYELKGGDLGENAKKALGLIGLQPGNEKDDSSGLADAFFPKEPQKLGAKWEVNGEDYAKTLKKNGLDVDAKDFKGQGQLLGVKTVDKVAYLDVQVTFELNGPMAYDAGFPGGAMKGKVLIKAVYSIMVPVDPSVSALRMTTDMTSEIDTANNGTPSMGYKVSSKIGINRDVMPLKLQTGG
jgi:hypothetical protein